MDKLLGEECQCSGPGYCEFLGRQMSSERHVECNNQDNKYPYHFAMFHKESLSGKYNTDYYKNRIYNPTHVSGNPTHVSGSVLQETAQLGPGTELTNLLSHWWWRIIGVKSTGTCKCKQLAARMNGWGVEGCRKNLELILDLLEENHTTQNIKVPYSRHIAKVVVLLAIKEAEGNGP